MSFDCAHVCKQCGERVTEQRHYVQMLEIVNAWQRRRLEGWSNVPRGYVYEAGATTVTVREPVHDR